MKKAGFQETRVEALVGPDSMVVGIKWPNQLPGSGVSLPAWSTPAYIRAVGRLVHLLPAAMVSMSFT